jgi:uncharacterized protein (DUF58 family)
MGLHWFFLAALLIFMLQSFLFTRFGHQRLSYRRTFSRDTCFQGDEIEMVEEIANRKFIPVPWLRVESQLNTGLRFDSQTNLDISSGDIYQNHKSFFSLKPYTKITRRHRVTGAKRGVYQLRSVSLTYGDLLGLRRAVKRQEFNAELIVYPNPHPLQELPLPSHSWQGDISVRRWIVDDPFMIAGVREYRAGDPLKGINWNATARSGRLQVHQLDYTADHRIMIVLNMEESAGMWEQVNDESILEDGISLAAGIAQYAVSRGMETGFAVNAPLQDAPDLSVIVPPRGGANHLTGLYETMARLVIKRNETIDVLLERLAETADRQMDILLLTAYFGPKIEMAAEALRAKGHAVQLVLLDQYRSQNNATAGETA